MAALPPAIPFNPPPTVGMLWQDIAGPIPLVGPEGPPIEFPQYIVDNGPTLGDGYADASPGIGHIVSVTAGVGLVGGGATSNINIALETPVSLAHGGTGATSAGSALIALGAAPIDSPIFIGDARAVTPPLDDHDNSIATTAFVKAQNYVVGGTFAPINSPVFTGDPNAPTPPLGDNDTSIATTAFVKAQGYATGGPFAPITSPVFLGDPRAPTPASTDNDTSIATTAFVKAVAPGIVIADTAPATTIQGAGWWDSADGQLYIFYNDGTSAQWVPASNQPGIGAPVSIAQGGTGATTGFLALDNLSAAGTSTGVLSRAAGGAWSVAPGAVGTITGVTAGTGLTGGGTSGAITLALSVPVAVANGGTGTTTAFTTGSVVFAGTSGVYSQDNANLFWDDTANRLGIGTASPGAPLTILNDGAQPAYPQAGYVTIDSQGNGRGVSYAAVAYGDSTTYPGLTTVHAGGTRAAPTAIGVNYATMSLQGTGHDGTGFAQGGGLQFFAPATWTSASHPVQFVLNTIASGSTTQTTRLTVTAAGDVGIGTIGPVSRLDISGASSTPSLSSSAGSIATFTANTGVQLQFGAINGGSYPAWIQAKVDAQNLAYPIALQPLGGNVGIGTASPGSPLVVGAPPTGTYTFPTAAGFYAPADTFAAVNVARGGVTNPQTMVFGVNQAGLYAEIGGFQENVAFNKLILQRQGGNVGIGTASPVAKLVVNQASNATLTNITQVTANNAIEIDTTSVGTNDYHPGLIWTASGGIPRAGVWAQTTNSGSYLYLGTSNNFSLGITNQAVTIRYDGNVGIGTATPGALLAVNGAAGNPTGIWSVVSAREMKQDVIRYERGLDAIVQLNPVMFRYRAGTPFAKSADEPSDLLIGLIADEVEPYVPEIVSEMTATVGEKSDVPVPALMPGLLIFAVINAMKEVVARLEALEAAA